MKKNSKLGIKPKIKVALALGSGGWRGLAHIGVIKALLKNNIPIDIITGVSTGALMGGFFAATNDIEQVENVMSQIKSRQIWSVFRDIRLTQGGIVTGTRYRQMISKYVKNKKIQDLERKFATLAVDFKTGKRVILDSGDLATAIHASTAVPFIFKPVKMGKNFLIDGAVKTPVPVLLAKNMGADVVLAVNLYKNVFPLKSMHHNPIQTVLRTTQLFLYQLSKQNCELADLTLWPEIVEPKKYSIFGNIVGNREVVGLGEAAVEEEIEAIKKKIRPYQVYIVKCSDGSYYTGISRDVQARVELHNRGKGAKYTNSRKPVHLVYAQPAPSRSAALKEEYRLKQLTHQQKAALVEDN